MKANTQQRGQCFAGNEFVHQIKKEIDIFIVNYRVLRYEITQIPYFETILISGA